MSLCSIVEFMSALAKNVTDSQAGNTVQIFNVGKARILPAICFEILDDKLLRILSKYDPGIPFSSVKLLSSNSCAYWVSSWVEKSSFIVIVIISIYLFRKEYLFLS